MNKPQQKLIHSNIKNLIIIIIENVMKYYKCLETRRNNYPYHCCNLMQLNNKEPTHTHTQTHCWKLCQMKANNLTYQHQSEVCNRRAGCCCFCWLINNSIKCMIDRFHFEYPVYACECICECLHILKRIGCSSLWRWFLHTSCCLCSGVSKYNQNNISILLDTIFYLWQACVFTSFLTLLSLQRISSGLINGSCYGIYKILFAYID